MKLFFNEGGEMKKGVIALMLITLYSVTGAFASGLSIPEQGAAAMAMSAAVTARSEDLSSIFYNPAGISYVDGFEVSAGIIPISPSFKYTPFREDNTLFEKADAKSKTFLPPQFYAAWRASSSTVLGIGVFSPLGMGTDWDRDWAGRYTSTFAEIQTINVNPTLAYTVNDKVTVGLGVSYIQSSAKMEMMVDTGSSLYKNVFKKNPVFAGVQANPDYDTLSGLDGNGSAFNFNIGTIIKATDQLQIGVSYRSAFDIEYDGDATFSHKETMIRNTVANATTLALQGSGLTDTAIAALASAKADTAYWGVSGLMPATQSGKATFKMPWMLNLGAKYDFSEIWDFSVDLDIVGWSVNDELVLDFGKDKPKDKLVMPKDWINSFVLRGGTSYMVNNAFVLRGGMLFDRNPVPEETIDGQLPDSNRWGLSVGAGYRFGGVRLDVSYMLLNFFRREKENGIGVSTDITGDGVIDRFDVPAGYPVGNGKYDSIAHLFAVMAGVAF